MTPGEQEWLTPAEVAERLKVNEQTIRKWLRDGELAGSLLGRVWRVSSDDVAAFMLRHRRGPKEGGGA